MDHELHVGYGVTIPVSEIEVRFSRAGGPGGQNVNKRATRAEVVFDLDGSPSVPPALKARARARLRTKLDARGRLRIAADDERTQRANRELAQERLAATLRAAFKPPAPPRKRTKPTKAARERRLADKKRRSVVKQRRARPAPDD